MLLAIDIGNTNTVFAVYGETGLLESWRCQTAPGRTADEYAALLSALFRLSEIAWGDVADVIVGSVVPDANFNIAGFSQQYLNRAPVFITKDLVRVSIDLPRPEEVGADRLVNAVAVLAHYQAPCVVIDFGTATTFDVITARGSYAGGVIAPGINLSLAALTRAAAKLPRVAVKKPAAAIGVSTEGAMQSGIFWGYMGLIEGIVGRIGAELGVKPFVIATGGLASLFAPHTAAIDTVDENLTLKGLFQIYQQMQGKTV